MNLYKESDLELINKKIRLNRIIYIALIVIFVTSTVLGLVLSDYYHKTLAMVLCSIVNTACAIFVVYFIFKNKHNKHLAYEYKSLLKKEKNEGIYKIVTISEKPITLADSSLCYEVITLVDEQLKNLYLSEVFDRNLLTLYKTYKLKTAFDYIVEIDDEN